MAWMFDDDEILQRSPNLRTEQGGGLLSGLGSAPAPASTGLLSVLNSPVGQGLLAGAFGALASSGRGRGLAGNLGVGGVTGLQAYAGAQESQQRQQELAELRKVRDLQVQRGTLELDSLRRQQADDEKTRRLLSESVQPQPQVPGLSPSINAGLPSDFGLPAAAAATATANFGAPPASVGRSLEWQRYKTLGDKFAAEGLASQAQKYYELADKFRPKFNTTPQVMRDPRTGTLVNMLVGEDGTTQVLPYGVKPDISLQDLGGRVAAIDRNAVAGGQLWNKSMSPDAAASNRLGWANYGLGRDRLAFDRTEAGTGKAPQGYRFKLDGSLEAIPGGPADIKAGELGSKTRSRAEHAVGQADVVIGTIDEALGKAGFFETGLTGSALGKIPGTDAYDLRRTVETVKANIGFDNLQRMREMSPTGGALGQVAVQELNALQSTVGNLDASQSQAVLQANLEKVRKHYDNWRGVMEQVAKGGEGTAPPGKPRTPSAAVPLPSTRAKDLRHGQAYTLPGGGVGVWDSMQKRFEVQ